MLKGFYAICNTYEHVAFPCVAHGDWKDGQGSSHSRKRDWHCRQPLQPSLHNPSWLRRRALDWIYQVIRKEDEFTKYIDIGPVNKMINMLCVWYVAAHVTTNGGLVEVGIFCLA